MCTLCDLAGTQTEPQTADIADLPIPPPPAAARQKPVATTITEITQQMPNFTEVCLTLE